MLTTVAYHNTAALSEHTGTIQWIAKAIYKPIEYKKQKK